MDTDLSTIAHLHRPAEPTAGTRATRSVTPERLARPLYDAKVVRPAGGGLTLHPLVLDHRGASPVDGRPPPTPREGVSVLRLEDSTDTLSQVIAAHRADGTADEDPTEQAYELVEWANDKLQASGSLPQSHPWGAVREAYLTAAALFARGARHAEATRAFVQCAGISRAMRLAASELRGNVSPASWSRSEESLEYDVAFALGCAAESGRPVDPASALDIVRDLIDVLGDLRQHRARSSDMLLRIAKCHRDAADLCVELDHCDEAEEHYGQAYAAYDEHDAHRGPGGTTFSVEERGGPADGPRPRWVAVQTRRLKSAEPLLPSGSLSLKRYCQVRRVEQLVRLQRYPDAHTALGTVLSLTDPHAPAAAIVHAQRLLCGMCDARGGDYALIVHRCAVAFDRATDLVEQLRDGIEHSMLRAMIDGLLNPSHDSAVGARRAADTYIEHRRGSPHTEATRVLLWRVTANIADYVCEIDRKAEVAMAFHEALHNATRADATMA